MKKSESARRFRWTFLLLPLFGLISAAHVACTGSTDATGSYGSYGYSK